MCQLHYAGPHSRALFGRKSVGKRYTVLKHLTENFKLSIGATDQSIKHSGPKT
ncbi:hypothetical protein SAMN05444171_2256 [Bradyrhizobium lablabi]|jgi:hypothetical protein|uniref:Uncharacterized protein n=2 Tax=Bradyrhizobium TaxID=374 RepID=A0ABY0PZR1_9BRAD|nr:hypothetical protein SAMN05444163_4907 [Bradyrhizobium ottawaense]SEC78523.1 hypothetical protein SAMN05444171_2256 [Bradyrhizobium lablabi]SHK90087.1 hypothetical protein SAMN05444321_1081 [Bradyrhizobium lablabi]